MGAAFCLGWRGENREPLRMPGPHPSRLLLGMQPHGLGACTNPPHWQGGGKVGEVGVAQARGWASRGCSTSMPDVSPSSCTHVPSAHPHLRVPVPSPAATVASQKEEVSPRHPPTSSGAILGLQESGRQHRASDALQHAGASGGWGKRNPNITLHPRSHLWDEERGSVSPEA